MNEIKVYLLKKTLYTSYVFHLSVQIDGIEIMRDRFYDEYRDSLYSCHISMPFLNREMFDVNDNIETLIYKNRCNVSCKFTNRHFKIFIDNYVFFKTMNYNVSDKVRSFTKTTDVIFNHHSVFQPKTSLSNEEKWIIFEKIEDYFKLDDVETENIKRIIEGIRFHCFVSLKVEIQYLLVKAKENNKLFNQFKSTLIEYLNDNDLLFK